MDKRLFFLLHKAHRNLFKQADKVCTQELGISSVQLTALFYVAKNEGCLLKELSEGLSLNNSAITGLISRMESSGLIMKAPCAEDARASRVFLRKKAKEILPKGKPILKKFNQEIAQDFSENELEIIYRFLNKMSQE